MLNRPIILFIAYFHLNAHISFVNRLKQQQQRLCYSCCGVKQGTGVGNALAFRTCNPSKQATLRRQQACRRRSVTRVSQLVPRLHNVRRRRHGRQCVQKATAAGGQNQHYVILT